MVLALADDERGVFLLECLGDGGVICRSCRSCLGEAGGDLPRVGLTVELERFCFVATSCVCFVSVVAVLDDDFNDGSVDCVSVLLRGVTLCVDFVPRGEEGGDFLVPRGDEGGDFLVPRGDEGGDFLVPRGDEGGDFLDCLGVLTTLLSLSAMATQSSSVHWKR